MLRHIDALWESGNYGIDWFKSYTTALRGAADRIDEAHAEDARKAHQEGMDAGMDMIADMEPQDSWLAEHGLCKLPVDADGRFIRPGEMTIEEEYGTKVAVLVDGFDSTMHRALASMLKELMDESYELGFKNGFAEGRKIGGDGK